MSSLKNRSEQIQSKLDPTLV